MPDAVPTRAQVLQAVPGYDAIFLSVHHDINTEFLDIAGTIQWLANLIIVFYLCSSHRLDIYFFSGPNLKVVSTMSAGYDHLDVPAIKQRGIKVGHTPNVLSAAVAEIAVMLMLNAARRAREGRLKLEA